MVAIANTGVIGEQQKRTYQASVANMKRGLFVVQGADDDHVAPVAEPNADAIGVIEESTVSAGDTISIIKGGEAVCRIGASVNAGQYCITDRNGRLVPSTEPGEFVVAKAVSSGANPSDFIVADILRFVR